MEVTTLDDRHPALVYSSGWSRSGDPEEYRETTSWTRTVGATVTVQFTGSRIVVFGTLSEGELPSSTYRVDNGPISVFTPNRMFTMRYRSQFYDSGALAPGTHTLVITNQTEDPDDFLYLDYLEVYRDTSQPETPAPSPPAPPPPPPSPSTTSTPRLAPTSISTRPPPNQSTPDAAETESSAIESVTTRRQPNGSSSTLVTDSFLDGVSSSLGTSDTHSSLPTADPPITPVGDISDATGSTDVAQSSNPSQGISLGVLIGSIAGVIGLTVFIIVIVLLLRRRKKRARRQRSSGEVLSVDNPSSTSTSNLVRQSSQAGQGGRISPFEATMSSFLRGSSNEPKGVPALVVDEEKGSPGTETISRSQDSPPPYQSHLSRGT
ncbi:hypothetical protein CC1G_15499 [Coprinopsis cinerea okayama7|uniref:Uncharacterized protein n=1 Tax=Coprinopsis cinerea (strain Okayama-7 / 130 / ATCC MYA-4618 / FGSC 9003) TaxID=240176 RepID=D6RN43_COPC7|nr:hypothetical protein CC1G_15499 [Coprinopsis cinerea okayama7\|eukprot:XP_002910958.1 hypothetical protein CC1G_15499 [Coprinopsis cinerea okayama7\